jgi:hypothetical protein
MIEIFNFEQGTPEWHLARGAMPTASRFKDVMAKGEGKTRSKYMRQLIGQRMTGEAPEGFSNAHTDRGNEMEPEARAAYAFMHDVEPVQVGFVCNRDLLPIGPVGCSPDSLVGDVGALEIKTRLPDLQIELLIADKVPSEHVAQIQGCLWVCDREWCDFVSYWPKLPMFTKRVYRDSAYIVKLSQEVKDFYEEMLELEHKLRAMM